MSNEKFRTITDFCLENPALYSFDLELYEYEIYNEEAQLLNTGETTLAFINMSNGRPVKMPENLKALISTYFKN